MRGRWGLTAGGSQTGKQTLEACSRVLACACHGLATQPTVLWHKVREVGKCCRKNWKRGKSLTRFDDAKCLTLANPILRHRSHDSTDTPVPVLHIIMYNIRHFSATLFYSSC